MAVHGSLEELRLSIPLVKLDVERRLVIGTAAIERPDKAREIMDYASAKPALEAWSKTCELRSGGLNKGHVRAMHNPRVAAGKLTEMSFDDNNKAVHVTAHIVDDQEWRKCLEGVYTGFSIGGGYAARWPDPSGLKRYTPRPREISLVDDPCIDGCDFAELVKMDGSVERLRLVGRVPGFAETLAEIRASRPISFREAYESRPRRFADCLAEMRRRG